MKLRVQFGSALACAALIAVPCYGQTASGIPHLQKQGTATQLIVDGAPFLAVSGELGNNTATSLENMQPIWSKLVAGNLNCVLAAVHWAQMEPAEGRYEFALVDGLIQEARRNNLKLVFLWFGSWKNGLSSYAPYWVKQDYKRFPRIQTKGGKTLELLSTFGDATRDADARAYRALMRHIKEVDGQRHTVVMMQVENEVGVLRDSRDRSAPANRAFAGSVPRELMTYLQQHKATLSPELSEVWAANGSKTSGTWEEVFGPGKPDSVDMPIQTNSPPLSQEEYQAGWRKLHWPVDEIFMAWHYARFVGKVIEEGKAEYNIPMYVNAWLQQPNMAWPGTYPSGGPLPQVHDIWRAGAPAADALAPDLYLQYFDEVCERFTRNGNPLFIPETSANAANVMSAFGKYDAMGFSPFGIERSVGPDTELAAAYRVISQLTPAIAAQQGKGTITAVRLNRGDAPLNVKLGDYTLNLSYIGAGRVPIAPEPTAAGQPRPQGAAAQGQAPSVQAAAILIAAGPDEFYFGAGAGGLRIGFTPNTSGPPIVGLGDVQEGKFVDGKWRVVRQLGGDDTGQGEILSLRPNTVLRVTVYRYE
jgi:beta-galactosidase GanA